MPHQSPYTQYYLTQAGGGFSQFYAGSSHQKGYGIGSFLGGLFRSILPVLRSGAMAVGREAARAGGNVLADIASGRNAQASVKTHMEGAVDNLATALKRKASAMTGSGIKRRKVSGRAHSSSGVRSVRKKKRVSPRKDIFS